MGCTRTSSAFGAVALLLFGGCAAQSGPRLASTAYPPQNPPRPAPVEPINYTHTVAPEDEWYMVPVLPDTPASAPANAAPSSPQSNQTLSAASVADAPPPAPQQQMAPAIAAGAPTSASSTSSVVGGGENGDKMAFVQSAYQKRGSPRVAVAFYDVEQTIMINPTLKPVYQRESSNEITTKSADKTGKAAESSTTVKNSDTIFSGQQGGMALATGGRALRVRGFASTTTLDRHGNVIRPEFFDIDTFMRNPQLWLNHELYKRPGTSTPVPVGTIESARIVRVSGSGVQAQIVDARSDQVVENIHANDAHNFILRDGDLGLWVTANVMEPEIVGLVQDGRLNAFSWAGRVTRSPGGGPKIDVLEISLVNLPANPEALFTVEGGRPTGSSLSSFGSPAQLITWSDVQQSVFNVLTRCGFKMADPEMVTLSNLDQLMKRLQFGTSLHTAEIEALRKGGGFEVLLLVQELREGDDIILQGRAWDLREPALLGAYRVPLLVSKDSAVGQILARKRARQLAGELALLAAQSWSQS